MSNFTDLTIDVAGNVIYGYAEPTISYAASDVLYTGITSFTITNEVDQLTGLGLYLYDEFGLPYDYHATTTNYDGEFPSGINDLIND